MGSWYRMKNKSPTPSAMGLNRCVNIFEKLMISTRPSPPKGNANIIFLDTPDLPYDWRTNKLSARGVFGKYFSPASLAVPSTQNGCSSVVGRCSLRDLRRDNDPVLLPNCKCFSHCESTVHANNIQQSGKHHRDISRLRQFQSKTRFLVCFIWNEILVEKHSV